jgi:hypothetical protein
MAAEGAAAPDLKVCVVGPACGKTLLCQALADQPIAPGMHEPTVGVRWVPCAGASPCAPSLCSVNPVPKPSSCKSEAHAPAA